MNWELVPVEIAQTLRMVRSLQKGRTAAKESTGVRPVVDQVVEKTLEYCSKTIQDMIRVQKFMRKRTIFHLNLPFKKRERGRPRRQSS